MKVLIITLFSMFLIGTRYAKKQHFDTPTALNKACECIYNNKKQSIGTIVCMSGWRMECKSNSKNQCEWLDTGEKCKK